MQLKKNVDDDYRKWKAGIVGGMNEAELINSFAGEVKINHVTRIPLFSPFTICKLCLCFVF